MKHNFAPNNAPFVLPPYKQMTIDHIPGSVRRKMKVRGVTLKAVKVFSLSYNLRNNLSFIEIEGFLHFDDAFFKMATHIFSKKWVTQATFLQWRNSDNIVVRAESEFPDEVKGLAFDIEGRKFDLIFRTDRSDFSRPVYFLNLTRRAVKSLSIDPFDLAEKLPHMAGRPVPFYLIDKIVKHFSLEWQPPQIEVQLPEPSQNQFDPDPDTFEYWIFPRTRVRETYSAQNQLFTRICHGRENKRWVEFVQKNGQRINIEYLKMNLKKEVLVFAVVKDLTPIRVDASTLQAALLEISGVLIPVIKLGPLLDLLHSANSPNFKVITFSVDLDWRLHELFKASQAHLDV